MMRLGLLLSPYRNLTTLCCAALSLHPHMQVMNHGFARIEAQGGLRFITDQSAENLERFRQMLIDMSAGGRQGDHGGSIIYSHAFEQDGVKEAYQRLIGDVQIKPDIRAVVWKEGGRLREYLKEQGISPLQLAARFADLYFISPVRNLLDHAYGLQKFYRTIGLQSYVQSSLPDLEIGSILRYIIACHAEFWNHAQTMPERFFIFAEAGMGGDVLSRLGRFLGVADEPAWIDQAAPLFVSKVHYEHTPADRALLARIVAEGQTYSREFLDFIGVPGE